MATSPPFARRNSASRRRAWKNASSSAGPANRALTIVLYLFQNGFEVGDLGYATAIGWALAVILVGCTMVQRLLARGEEASA